MRRFGRAALALGYGWLAAAHAQAPAPERGQDPAPDLDFLEYLGTWAEEDDEWLAIETWQRDVGGDADENEEPEEPESNGDDDDESE
jgi:hypothetical protein